MPKSIQIAADALRSPLSHLRPAAARGDTGLRAAELPNLGYIVLRGRQDDGVFMDTVAAVLGAPLPRKPRATVRCAAGVVLWQSPDEWWLLCARSGRDALVNTLEKALQGCFAQVADNSGGFTSLRLQGAAHQRLLNHLSPYDFDHLAVGQCVSTVLSKATFTVLRTDEQGVTLVFRRSFAGYIWQLIERTAVPYGLQLTDARSCTDAWLAPLLAGGAKAQRGQPSFA